MAEDRSALEGIARALRRLTPGGGEVATPSSRIARDRDREILVLERLLSETMKQVNGICLLPPEPLRLNVGAVTSAANFWKQGRDSSRRVIEVFGVAPDGLVLDWGCGSGRTLNWIWGQPAWREAYLGCDVDAAAIGWLRSRGFEDRVQTCGDLPPLPYPDNHFQGLFSFSVLTHIHPLRHGAWVQEARRVLAPGGRAYLTFNSDTRIAEPRAFAANDEADYRRQGWCFAEHDGHYKSAAVTSWALFERGLEGFEIEQHRPGGYHRMDDVILRKL